MDPENPESKSQADADDGMVDIHDAQIADIDQALANAQAQEKALTPLEDGNSVSTNEPPVTPQKPAGDPADAGGVVTQQGADSSKPLRTYTEDEIREIVAQNERQKQEGNRKELFIQHRGNELGKLRSDYALTRRQLEEAKSQLANGLQDRFAEDPVKASNDRDRIKEIDTQIDGLNSQEERAAKIVEAQTFFLRHVDIDQVSLDDVAEVLKADGLEDRFLAQFKSNPWEFTSPEALVQMGRRAFERKQYVTADSDRRLLAKHVLTQNEEIARLKTRPGQVMKQVQKNLNQTPSVNAQSSASPNGARTVNESVIPHMSDAELNAALQSSMRH